MGIFFTQNGLWAMEKCRLVPKGTHAIGNDLATAAEALIAGGQTKLFTPMALWVCTKVSISLIHQAVRSTDEFCFVAQELELLGLRMRKSIEDISIVVVLEEPHTRTDDIHSFSPAALATALIESRRSRVESQ